MKFYIDTLGCKVNQFESQALATLLAGRGHEETASAEEADAIIINTCTVTAESSRKSRQAVRHVQGKNPNAITAVCGCWSQIAPEQARELGVQLVAGSGDRHEFVSSLEDLVNGLGCSDILDDPRKRNTFEQLPAGSYSGRTRAVLKIQDGCDNFCSYCIIPYARGRVRSLPKKAALEQAAEVAENGFKELVITGIEIASYGKDSKEDLCELISEIAESCPQLRLRLGSLEPRIVTKQFCEKLSRLPNICRHFHLALQSGCDETLVRMNRKYDTERFLESVILLREYFENCEITTDLVVGFPGETEEEFEKTLEFLKKCEFSYVHIFPYSQRPGTKAADMEGQLTNKVKHDRAKRALYVMEKLQRERQEKSIGSVRSVLFETAQEEYFCGHCGEYFLVKAKGENLRGQVKNVLIEGIEKDVLKGKII